MCFLIPALLVGRRWCHCLTTRSLTIIPFIIYIWDKLFCLLWKRSSGNETHHSFIMNLKLIWEWTGCLWCLFSPSVFSFKTHHGLSLFICSQSFCTLKKKLCFSFTDDSTRTFWQTQEKTTRSRPLHPEPGTPITTPPTLQLYFYSSSHQTCDITSFLGVEGVVASWNRLRDSKDAKI